MNSSNRLRWADALLHQTFATILGGRTVRLCEAFSCIFHGDRQVGATLGLANSCLRIEIKAGTWVARWVSRGGRGRVGIVEPKEPSTECLCEGAAF